MKCLNGETELVVRIGVQMKDENTVPKKIWNYALTLRNLFFKSNTTAFS